jgi:2-hydroxychromene-2-carboxylate isomerase
MTSVTWYFDFISPFAYLHWPRVQELARQREVAMRPLLFAGLLSAHGHKGPAEIASKRRFTYRYVAWLAERLGVPLRFPPAHPFNPVAALRLCVAAGSTPAAIEAIFAWIWRDGRAGDSVEALAPLAQALGVDGATWQGETTKARLRANFDEALAQGVFGVPTLAVDGELFWGQDAHDFALAALADPARFAGPAWRALDALPMAAVRPQSR